MICTLQGTSPQMLPQLIYMCTQTYLLVLACKWACQFAQTVNVLNKDLLSYLFC